LQVSKTQILMTGGTGKYKQVLMLDTVKHKTVPMCPLAEGRELHAMTWIDGYPAVIGGYDEHHAVLDSVEVLQNTPEGHAWVKKADLKHRRYGHSACSLADRAWVIGGAVSNTEPVLLVEEYHNEQWTVLQVTLPVGLVGLGLLPLQNEIYIFGGFTIHKKNVDSVYCLNTQEYKVIEKPALKEPVSFSQNLWSYKNKVLEGRSFKGEKFSYHLE
jgi:hypothetical protein